MPIIAFVPCKYDREPMSLNYIYIYIYVYPFLKTLPRPLSWISNHRRYTIEALLRNNFAYVGGGGGGGGGAEVINLSALEIPLHTSRRCWIH